jgi:hypothetical protein
MEVEEFWKPLVLLREYVIGRNLFKGQFGHINQNVKM